MSLKIAIEGIDGSGKTNIARYLSNSKDRLCVKIAFVGFTNSNISTSPLARWVGKKTKKIVDLGSKNSNKFIEGTGYLMNLVPYLIAQFHAKKYDVILSDRDAWVTHSVYAGAVSKVLEKIFDRYFRRYAVYPEVLFYLKTDVKNSLKRTKKRGYFQNHENEACLVKINCKYDAVINRIKKKCLSEIIEIDTNNRSLGNVCTKVEIQIRNILKIRADQKKNF